MGEVRAPHRPERHPADRRRAGSRPRPSPRRLAGHRFALVLTSPRSRAAETARLAGFPDADPSSRTSANGTTASSKGGRPPRSGPRSRTGASGPGPGARARPSRTSAVRADRVIERCLDPAVDGDVLLFAHGHLLRVLAARWIRLPADAGRRLRPRHGHDRGPGLGARHPGHRDLERGGRRFLTSRGFKMSGRHSVGADARTRGST